AYDVYEVTNVMGITMTYLSIPAGIIAIIGAGLTLSSTLKELMNQEVKDGKQKLVGLGAVLMLSMGYWIFL
ncbi:MAG: hypothetical protein HRT74_11330, partial [Flavobacteriales bacterium]|nr:hypothetical protein [Flavobacteriales bacterium]